MDYRRVSQDNAHVQTTAEVVLGLEWSCLWYRELDICYCPKQAGKWIELRFLQLGHVLHTIDAWLSLHVTGKQSFGLCFLMCLQTVLGDNVVLGILPESTIFSTVACRLLKQCCLRTRRSRTFRNGFRTCLKWTTSSTNEQSFQSVRNGRW